MPAKRKPTWKAQWSCMTGLRPRSWWSYVLLFLAIGEGFITDKRADGAPTESRRRLYQTSANPIPYPDKMSLKKSATADKMNDQFYWINFGSHVYSTTPQVPQEEVGVKKSSTAERPLGIEPSTVRDSVESILNLKTNPNSAGETKFAEEGNLLPRVLRNDDKLETFWSDKRARLAKKFVTPDSVAMPESLVLRGQSSRNPIARPEIVNENSSEKTDGRGELYDADSILERKTLLYSEPSYRPGTGPFRNEENSDPRQLISLLGNPSSYKKSHVVTRRPSLAKKVQIRYEPDKLKEKERHHGSWQRKHDVGNLGSKEDMEDQADRNMDSFLSSDLGDGLTRRDPSEHHMLEHLLEDNSPSFGTRDEQREQESTIKQIEQLTAQSSTLSKEFDPSLPSSFSNMEISEGELPDYDNIHRYFRTRIPTKKLDVRGFGNVESKQAEKRVGGFLKQKSQPSQHLFEEFFPRYYIPYIPIDPRLRGYGPYDSSKSLNKRTRRSSHRHHYHHPLHHHHHWNSRDLPFKADKHSRYYDYPEEAESEKFSSPADLLSSFTDFPQFPVQEKFPRFPLSLMAERFVAFPHLPKISEFAPLSPAIEKIERLPEPSPIPPAIVNKEQDDEDEVESEPITDTEAEPFREWAPYPEAMSAPEPTPIPEIASIREIPPIAEPKEPSPAKLDPKKTFGTGESNGGVKKSTSG